MLEILFYYLTDWTEIFRVYAFLPEVLSWYRAFFRVYNGLKVVWTQSWKKMNTRVKPLVHMSWKFNWIILAPIYCISENRFLIWRLGKKVISTWNFFFKNRTLPEKKLCKKKLKTLSTNFFICGYCLEEGQGNNFYLVHY